MKKTYSELLLDPRWQKKRLSILNRDNFSCVFCQDKKTTLHIHHKFYKKGAKPWEYEDEALLTLCSDCHFVIEDNKKYDMGCTFINAGKQYKLPCKFGYKEGLYAYYQNNEADGGIVFIWNFDQSNKVKEIITHFYCPSIEIFNEIKLKTCFYHG